MQNHIYIYNQREALTPLLSEMNSLTIVSMASLKAASHLVWPATTVVP